MTGFVALFTRAWIEMQNGLTFDTFAWVALFTRAWIEIENTSSYLGYQYVALFTRAWIEIATANPTNLKDIGRPLHEGVD